MTIQETLSALNLRKNEQDVFLTCLDLGKTTITPIARKTNLPRTTVYQILERLEERQLVEVGGGTRRTYIACSPQTILAILKQEKTQLEDRIDAFEKALPELTSRHFASMANVSVRFFGRNDIRTLGEEILDSPINEICYFGGITPLLEILGKRYVLDWMRRRIKKGIRSRTLTTLERPNDIMFTPSKKAFRTIRRLPKRFSHPAHLMIYGNNVAMLISSEEELGVVIHSREFAQTMQDWFNFLWAVAKEEKSKRN